MLSVILLLAGVALTAGSPHYRDKIPNGRHVVDPCMTDEGNIWEGVGHFRVGGGGDLNPFGEHFQNAGHTWTTELCELDSDQDGRSNGEELGDPDCIWQEGQEPSTTQGITHPGVCEPMDSPGCQAFQPDLTCNKRGGYECPEIHASTTMTHNMTFPVTEVPDEETTYYCKIFQVPSDKDYHAFAFEPILDNLDVIHHMILFGCDDTIHQESDAESCGMADVACQHLVALWTVGVDGYCLHDKVGMKFGKNSYKFMAIQVHWNNPTLHPHYTDASGMRMFYTEQLREYEESIFQTGQLDIAIPPLTSRYTVESTCVSRCTEDLRQAVNITKAAIHMHYLGMEGKVELFRNGELAYTLLHDDPYMYESPILHEYDPPLVMLPGDEIVTTCYFNTLDGTKRREMEITYGEGTQDEMCFAFMFYYPGSPDFQCIQYGDYDTCPAACDYDNTYEDLTEAFEYMEEKSLCDKTIVKSGVCDYQCYATLYSLLRDSCTHDLIDLMRNNKEMNKGEHAQYMFSVYDACNTKYQNALDLGIDTKDPWANAASRITMTTIWAMLAAVVVGLFCTA